MLTRLIWRNAKSPCLAAAILVGISVSVAQAQDVSLPPELQEVRAGLEKYQDVIVAVHDGYLSTIGCIEYPQGMEEGSMSYVASRMLRLGSRSSWAGHFAVP